MHLSVASRTQNHHILFLRTLWIAYYVYFSSSILGPPVLRLLTLTLVMLSMLLSTTVVPLHNICSKKVAKNAPGSKTNLAWKHGICIHEWIMENVEGGNENVGLNDAPNSNGDG